MIDISAGLIARIAVLSIFLTIIFAVAFSYYISLPKEFDIPFCTIINGTPYFPLNLSAGNMSYLVGIKIKTEKDNAWMSGCCVVGDTAKNETFHLFACSEGPCRNRTLNNTCTLTSRSKR